MSISKLNDKLLDFDGIFLVHYGEIGLKGKNRPIFEKKLADNIKRLIKKKGLNYEKEYKIVREKGRILVYFKNEKNNKSIIEDVLKKSFGIVNFSFVHKIEKNFEKLKTKFLEILENIKKPKNEITLGFKTKRADKNFTLTSPEITSELRKIAEAKGFKVDYKNFNVEIYTEISHNNIYLYLDKEKGPKGLPVGTVGKVLVLLSGGIDSPISAYEMMKRGCRCDFLHVHNLINENSVLNSKIVKTVKKLNEYQLFSNLFIAPYNEFNFELLGKKVDQRYELVLFKFFILKLADEIAKLNKYDAIVTGDNLAQVASQTMENLKVVSKDIDTIIFRPLLTYDKEDIIKKSKEYNLFEIAIEEYKDCCSLVSKNPTTKAKYEKFKTELNKIDMNKIISNTIKKIKKEFIYN